MASDPRPRLETIHDDALIQVCAVAATAAGRPLVVSFTGLGGGADVAQGPEFVGSATAGGSAALFVVDKTCSWYNAPGVYERVIGLVGPRAARAEAVVTLGNSMGGFGAVLFAAPLGARAALAFSPQVSVSPKIVPQERRWPGFVAKIAAFRFEDANDHMSEAVDYLLLHGSGALDAYHIEAFRPRPRLSHYVFPGIGHKVCIGLKDQGALPGLVAAAIDGDLAAFDARVLAAGAVRRGEAGSAIRDLEATRAARRAARKAEKRAARLGDGIL